MTITRRTLWIILLFSFASISFAQEGARNPAPARASQPGHRSHRPRRHHARETTKPSAKEEKDREKESADKLKVTEHSLRLGQRELKYKATTGTLAQKDESGNTKADMFFVAYELLDSNQRDDEDDLTTRPASTRPSTRPVTFVFNGGPGAASVWLHIGTAGPKRIDLEDDGNPAPPPYHLVPNESTWLDATDLVFIDPVGTGYSRPPQAKRPSSFTASAKTCSPSPPSSACGPRATTAGSPQVPRRRKLRNTPAPPVSPSTCSTATASASMASS
jgi:carboxypeptidase C (cathepsin A)